MLGLDAGWNCHISLGNDPITILSDPQLEEETRFNSPRRSFTKFHSYHHHQHNKRHRNYRANSNYNYSSRKRVCLLNRKNYFTSLPDLKFSKYKMIADPNTKGSLNPQIVKFDLSNLNETNSRLDRMSFRRKKLKRLNSNGSYISNDSEDWLSDLRQRNSINILGTVPSQITNSSSKSNSLRTTLSKVLNPKSLFSFSSGKLQEDENSSHFTVNSGRTLSETEILGNAVIFIIYLIYS